MKFKIIMSVIAALILFGLFALQQISDSTSVKPSSKTITSPSKTEDAMKSFKIPN